MSNTKWKSLWDFGIWANLWIQQDFFQEKGSFLKYQISRQKAYEISRSGQNFELSNIFSKKRIVFEMPDINPKTLWDFEIWTNLGIEQKSWKTQICFLNTRYQWKKLMRFWDLCNFLSWTIFFRRIFKNKVSKTLRILGNVLQRTNYCHPLSEKLAFQFWLIYPNLS